MKERNGTFLITLARAGCALAFADQCRSGFAAQTISYDNGDSNFSGNIDADDYFGIDQSYSSQGPPL